MKILSYSLLAVLIFSIAVFSQDAAAELVTHAQASIGKKDYDTALADLTQSISAKKKNAEAFMLRGDVYMAKNQVELARADYNQAIKLNSKVSAYYLKRGLTFKESPGYDRVAAMADFNKALDLDALNEDALRERGFTYYVDDKIPAAITDFEAALKLNPKDAPIYAYLARIAKKTSMDEALKYYNIYLGLKTDDPYAYVERGQILESQSKNILALDDYNRVIKLLPNDAIGYSNRADVYLRQEKYKLGIADLNKTIEMRPNDSSGYSRRGRVYEFQGKLDIAIDDYDHALKLDQYNSFAKTRRPLALEKLKALIPFAEERSAAFNSQLKIYSAKAETFNAKSEEFFKIDEAQRNQANRDVKMICGKVAELRSLFGEVTGGFAPIQKMYDAGQLAGFTKALEKTEEIKEVLNNTDEGVREYETYYKCIKKTPVYYVIF